MGLTLRYFSVEEAEALLPQIRPLLAAARETKTRIEAKVAEWREAARTKKLPTADEALFQGQVDFLADQLENHLKKIAEMGCLPKDLDAGLVDFPARIDGREAYLCWRMEEEKIRFWHTLTGGFSGRQPLENEGKDHGPKKRR